MHKAVPGTMKLKSHSLFKGSQSIVYDYNHNIYLEKLCAQISGDGLHQTKRPLDGVFGVADLTQMDEDADQCLTDAV